MEKTRKHSQKNWGVDEKTREYARKVASAKPPSIATRTPLKEKPVKHKPPHISSHGKKRRNAAKKPVKQVKADVSKLKTTKLKFPNKKELQDLFLRMDDNSTGNLSLVELEKAVITLYPNFNNKPALAAAHKSTDSSGDGFVQQKEFTFFVHYLVYYNNIWSLFSEGDENSDRRITRDEFMEIAKKIDTNNKEPNDLFDAIDTNQGGMILFDELCNYLAVSKSEIGLDEDNELQEQLDAALDEKEEKPSAAVDGNEKQPNVAVNNKQEQSDAAVNEKPKQNSATLDEKKEQNSATLDEKKQQTSAASDEEKEQTGTDSNEKKEQTSAASDEKKEQTSAVLDGKKEEPSSTLDEKEKQVSITLNDDKEKTKGYSKPFTAPKVELKRVKSVAVAEIPTIGKEEGLKVFDELDDNASGKLSLAELDKGVTMLWRKLDNKPAIMAAYKASDRSENGYVERCEFGYFLRFIHYHNNLWLLFDIVDEDNDRRISKNEFLQASPKLNIDNPLMVFGAMDTNDGGKILFDELCDYMAANFSTWGDEADVAKIKAKLNRNQPESQSKLTPMSKVKITKTKPTSISKAQSAWNMPQDIIHVSLPDKEEEIKVFDELDVDASGKLSIAELDQGVIKIYPELDNVSSVLAAFKASDRDGDGLVDRDEFSYFLKYILYYNNLWSLFEASVEGDSDRQISKDDFLKVSRHMEIDNPMMAFNKIKRDGKKKVLFDEICDYMSTNHGITNN